MNIQQHWVVGTAEDCDVKVTDEYASDYHCLVGRSLEGWYFVRDMGSTNGTVIITESGEWQKVWGTWTRILPGQTLRVGRSLIPWEAGI